MLCNQAKEKKTQYLYRKTIPNGSAKCPKFLTRWGVSYNISYSEVSIESSQFQEVENCGEPRSELNSCFRQGLLYRWTEHSILPMPTGRRF